MNIAGASTDRERYAAENRAAFIKLLYTARDLMPSDAMTAQLKLDAEESAWLFDCMRLLQTLGTQCGVDLCPYGWWKHRASQPDYEKFKLVMQRVTTKALNYSKVTLDFA